jgi:hypothetical protein
MVSIDQSTIWQALEERLARTENPRHRRMLEVAIEHGKAEADRSIDRLMATLVPDPQYHFWIGGRDLGPKGYDGVLDYYTAFVGAGGAIFESPKHRVVLDDENIALEGTLRQMVTGADAKRRGYDVPDESGHYLVECRTVVFWSFGSNDLAIGEDSFTTMHPDDFEKVPDDELPPVYRDYLAEIGKLDVTSA